MTTAKDIHSSKPRTTTWDGGEGTLTIFARTASGTSSKGERVAVIDWTDGLVTVKHIKGDGRTQNFQCFDEHTVATMDDARRYAQERLA